MTMENNSTQLIILPSTRQLEVAKLYAQGYQLKQVAYLLNITQHTVEKHLERTYRILKVNDKIELLRKLFNLGYIQYHEFTDFINTIDNIATNNPS